MLGTDGNPGSMASEACILLCSVGCSHLAVEHKNSLAWFSLPLFPFSLLLLVFNDDWKFIKASQKCMLE